MTLTTVSPALLDTQAQYTGFKNRIINGDMRIDQRNAGASFAYTNGVRYTLDRWAVLFDNGTGHTIQQVADAPAGLYNSVKVTIGNAASPASNQQNLLFQTIEGYNAADLGFGTAAVSTVSFSFWVKSSVTGTYNLWLLNAASTRSFVSTYVVNTANAWEKKFVTLTGDAAGTWLKTNGGGLIVGYSLGTGSGFNAPTVNTWSTGDFKSTAGATSVVGTSGATFYVTGVQLEKGSTATAFDYLDYGRSLIQCQRYFQSYVNPPLRGVAGSDSRANRMGMILPVPMRAAPSIAMGALNIYDGVSAGTVSSIFANYCTSTLLEFDLNCTVGFGAGRAVTVFQNPAATLAASAEL
jgi:hypothetical protein